MRAFFRQGESAVALLDVHEREAILTAVNDVLRLLDEHSTPGLSPDADPAWTRLFPVAAPSNPDISDEYRRLTEGDLSALKADRLRAIRDELSSGRPEWTVSLEEGLATAAALTDVRLVIATRLELKTDEDAELLYREIDLAQGILGGDLPEGLGVDYFRIWFASVYQALTWLQESLVTCLMDREGARDE